MARRYEIAKAIYGTAQARQLMLHAADETADGSQAGSVGHHSIDVRSDTESHGPSLPCTAQEYPSVGISSSSLQTTPTPTMSPTPTIYDDFSAGRGIHTFDAIDSVYTSCVPTEQSGAASDAGLSRTRPAPHSPWASTGKPGASAGGAMTSACLVGQDRHGDSDGPISATSSITAVGGPSWAGLAAEQ